MRRDTFQIVIAKFSQLGKLIDFNVAKKYLEDCKKTFYERNKRSFVIRADCYKNTMMFCSLSDKVLDKLLNFQNTQPSEKSVCISYTKEDTTSNPSERLLLNTLYSIIDPQYVFLFYIKLLGDMTKLFIFYDNYVKFLIHVNGQEVQSFVSYSCLNDNSKRDNFL